jgi:hypothetical protein
VIDAAPAAVIDAAPSCPRWATTAATGRAWLYTRVVSTTGVALTAAANHVDIYVRRPGDPLPGERAQPDDPCAVASYDLGSPTVRVLVAAIGFSSQDREFSPQICVEASPCAIELPNSLDARYYVATAGAVSLQPASAVPEADRAEFAAAAGEDAVERAKALHRPLADELARTGKATDVPAIDLAVRFTERKLRKRCDASCLDEPALDPAVRSYLKQIRRAGEPDPFVQRTSPGLWRRREP